VKVLLINQFFWPDMAATAQLLADLAEDLAADGWQVTALKRVGLCGWPSDPLREPKKESFRLTM
jgi:hypothetical protein